jgi:hypothetical protein
LTRAKAMRHERFEGRAMPSQAEHRYRCQKCGFGGFATPGDAARHVETFHDIPRGQGSDHIVDEEMQLVVAPAQVGPPTPQTGTPKLISCGTCGQQIAVNAKACPHCGAPPPAQVFRTVVIGVLSAIAFMVIGVKACVDAGRLEKQARELQRQLW